MLSPRLVVASHLSQAQTVSPRLQHAVRLLQMSSQEFLQSVDHAAQNNPFLDSEVGDDDDDGLLSPPLQALVASEPVTAEAAERDPAAGSDAAGDDGAGGDAEDGVFADAEPAEDWHSAGSGEPAGITALDLTAASQTLAQHLHAQLGLLQLPPRDRALAHAVVDLLDDDGYLRCEPREALAGWDDDDPAPAVDDAELQVAVRRVQSLDPAGVGARSVQECLLLQLDGVDDAGQRELMRAILVGHMAQLATRDQAAIARALKKPAADVEAACARIRRLDPRPGWRHGGTTAPYVIPDVIVRRHRGAWRVMLNPAVVPRVRLNRRIAELFQGSRQAGGHPGLSGQLQEARWTLRNVDQRFCTIVAIAQAIVDRQQLCLDYGDLALKPLCLADIAAAVGVHPSTVSRSTCNKYMAAPAGVFELKSFFSRGMPLPSGKACSATAMRSLVRDLIAGEHPDHPLSDVELADRLRMQGFPLARRTVTKYRMEMRIDISTRRRPVAA